jgi:hypothetical protein
MTDAVEGNYICSFEPPEKLIDPNQIQLLAEVDGLNKFSNERIAAFHKQIAEGDCRIATVNGHRAPSGGITCDYCIKHVGGSKDWENLRYCYTCNTNMCMRCYSVATRKITLRNGAKRWHKRKYVLQKCRNEHELYHRDITHIGVICDSCYKEIPVGKDRYTNREDYVDECIDCHTLYENENGNVFYKMRFSSGKRNSDNFIRFGSVFDWAPLYSGSGDDDKEDLILQCVNPKSKFFKRIALSCKDGQGLRGFYSCPEEDTLDSLIKEYKIIRRETEKRLKRYEEKKNLGERDGKKDEEDTASSSYCTSRRYSNTPIKQMMVGRNMKIRFVSGRY